MKYTYNLILAAAIFLLVGCEREFDSEGIAEGVIRYPSILLNQGPSFAMVANGDYEELGAVALLGTDDISEQLVIEGVEDIDASTPGVYPVTYSVSITNELGTQTTVTQTRYVVVSTEDVSDIDLSGNYRGTGFSSTPRTVEVVRLGPGLYSIPDVLSSSNGIAAIFAHIGGDAIVIPNQETSFGYVNTTSAGTSATLTANGFRWSVFIECCGVFGPIDFVKQ